MNLGSFIQRAVTVGRVERNHRFPGDEDSRLEENCVGAKLLHGKPEAELAGSLLVGVDLGLGEILIADRLRERGQPLGLVLGHRTACCRSARVPGLILPPGHLRRLWLSATVELPASLSARGTERDLDAARLLDIPYACVDQPVHRLLTDWLQQRVDEAAPLRLGDLVELLCEIDEFRQMRFRGNPVRIIRGDPKAAAGTVCLATVGGSRGGIRDYRDWKRAGVRTLVVMNAGSEQRAEADRLGLHLLELDYLAADTLGLNLLIDAVFAEEAPLRVMECSGFRRVARRVTVRPSAICGA